MDAHFFNIEKHLQHFITKVIDYAPNVLSAIIVLIVGLWIIKRLANIATKAMEKRELEVSLRTFLKSLISIGLKVILIVTVAGMMGIGTTSFVTILGAAGLAVGLALQGSLSNFAGGVLILIFKPYKVGDAIEAQGQKGVVKEIQIFNTILLTSDMKTIILPNGSVSNGTIINHTKQGMLRGDINVPISINNNIDVVISLIMEALSKHELILKSPELKIEAVKIDDGKIVLSIKPYVLADNLSGVQSDTLLLVQSVLDKNGINC